MRNTHIRVVYGFGVGATKDVAKAFAYDARGCGLGEIEVSCCNAGTNLLDRPRLTPADKARMLAWLKAACDQGVSKSCFHVAAACDTGCRPERV